MYIDENMMKEYLSDNGKFDALCKQKEKIKARFEFVSESFKQAMSIGGSILDKQDFSKVKWENGKMKQTGGEAKRKMFAPKEIGLTEGERYSGVVKQKKYFDSLLPQIPQIGKKVENILSIVGGFSDRKVVDEYRIIGNYPPNAKEPQISDYNSSIIGRYSETQRMPSDWITAHFADNTLFLDFISFMIKVKGQDNVELDSYKNIALCYPEGKSGGKISKSNESKEIEIQRQVLAYRFPLKFLWMWANKDNVIHPLSLMAFREFLKSEFMSEVFKILSQEGEQCFSGFSYDDNNKTMEKEFSTYAEKITNAKIECFPKIWEKVSEAIMNKLKEVCGEKQSTEKVSQLISLLTLGETDMTNIDELLKTHKQIILYGVPGTGKTHSAKELIKKWSKEAFQVTQEESKKEDDLKDWQFSKIINTQNTQDDKKSKTPIVWDIMQFHPNTTYQDFIGGIIPKTQNGSLTYGVESGKFKRFCEYASVNSQTPFVFIIDEINRANLSEVLGELLYALEYRDEGITIPNFNKLFVIPSNVYIIGTMNNVDKSLSTFDLALRRRFGFYEIGVDCDVIEKMLEDKVEEKVLKKYIGRCQDLNALVSGEIEEEDRERLRNEEKLNLEKHYKIGQAYFAKIERFLQKGEAINPNHLRKLWDYHLQPLIEEYIGFSMNDKEISNKLKRLKDFWTKKLLEENEYGL